jgi:hypothetical protein
LFEPDEQRRLAGPGEGVYVARQQNQIRVWTGILVYVIPASTRAWRAGVFAAVGCDQVQTGRHLYCLRCGAGE